MLIPAGDLWRFEARAVDGTVGRIQDLQVDRRWIVRDIVVDVGHWLTGRLLLIRPSLVVKADLGSQTIHLALTAEQIADAEASASDAPRLRQCEAPVRSLRALRHYGIEAGDGAAGDVEDWLVDLQTWRTRCVMVKTGGNGTPRRNLVPVQELGVVSWSVRTIYADLSRAAISLAPEYEPAGPPDSGPATGGGPWPSRRSA